MTRIINIFRRNIMKKIIALGAAFFMWVFVMAEQDPEIEDSYTVPLTISNVPYEFKVIYDETPIQVNVRAPRSSFVRYNANAFRVYLNLENLNEGEHQIRPQVVMPPGFELISTKPLVIDVKLDPIIEKQMPFELITTGSVSQDSAITEIRKSTEIVTVVGPRSFIEQVDKVYGIINFTGNTSSFEVQIPMNAVDEKNNIVPNVRVVPGITTVSVEIESGLKKKIVPVIPELSVADGWELTKIMVEPAQMEVIGAESVINSIVTLKTEPFTVQTGQKNFKSTLNLVVPDGVTIKSKEVMVSAEVVRKPVPRDQTNN